jgi:hypothetical protein
MSVPATPQRTSATAQGASTTSQPAEPSSMSVCSSARHFEAIGDEGLIDVAGARDDVDAPEPNVVPRTSDRR